MSVAAATLSLVSVCCCPEQLREDARRARERFIGPALCAETGVGDGTSASIDSFALAGPIVISLLHQQQVLLEFTAK